MLALNDFFCIISCSTNRKETQYLVSAQNKIKSKWICQRDSGKAKGLTDIAVFSIDNQFLKSVDIGQKCAVGLVSVYKLDTPNILSYL